MIVVCCCNICVTLYLAFAIIFVLCGTVPVSIGKKENDSSVNQKFSET